MASIEGAGGAEAWDVMNQQNQRMMKNFMKSKETKVNVGRSIGVKMIEWVE